MSVAQRQRLETGLTGLLGTIRLELAGACIVRVADKICLECACEYLPTGLEGVALELAASLYRFYDQQGDTGILEAVREGDVQWQFACPLPQHVLNMDAYRHELSRYRCLHPMKGGRM